MPCNQIVSELPRFYSGAWQTKKLIQRTIHLLSNDAGVQQSRGGGRYTAPVKLYRSNARQSFLKVWLGRPKRVRRLSRTCWRSDQREDMRLNELNYKIYRASKGEVSFSRWEVFHKNRRTVPLKSGFIYGTMADARIRASDAMSKLADTGKAQTKRVAPPARALVAPPS